MCAYQYQLKSDDRSYITSSVFTLILSVGLPFTVCEGAKSADRPTAKLNFFQKKKCFVQIFKFFYTYMVIKLAAIFIFATYFGLSSQNITLAPVVLVIYLSFRVLYFFSM